MPLVLMVAPLAPHIAEELWARLGHADTLTYESFPTADPQWLVEDRSRCRCRSTARCGRGSRCRSAPTRPRTRPRRAPSRGSPSCSTGATVRKLKVVPGKIVNFVVA